MSSSGNDYTLGTVIRYIFNTINQSKVPATPSVGFAFAVYKNSSVSEYTLPGANVVTDFDGIVGCHRVTIDTSDPFFVVGEDYSVVFTAGTVDGYDLTRNVVFRFSIENQNNKVNTVQLAGQTVTASSAVAFPASVANEVTVALRATQISVNNIPTASQNAAATWSALHTDNWPNNSFGSGVLISHSTPRTVDVTGSRHIAADVHEFQPGVITEGDFATDALSARVLAADGVTEIVTGVWSRDLSSFGANTAGNNVFTILARIPAALPQLVTDLTTMLVSSGTALVKWTATALSLAPAGGGGGGTTVVSPEAFINLDNTLLEKNTFVFFNNESRTYLVSLTEGNFDGQAMTFCIEKSDKTTLIAVTGLTSVTNSVSVTIPTTAEQTEKCMQWSLRDSTTGRIILYGPAVQKYAAFNN